MQTLKSKGHPQALDGMRRPPKGSGNFWVCVRKRDSGGSKATFCTELGPPLNIPHRPWSPFMPLPGIEGGTHC